MEKERLASIPYAVNKSRVINLRVYEDGHSFERVVNSYREKGNNHEINEDNTSREGI